ncbi:MAG: hypothetical protein M5U11_05190 [Anaerolineales bacterium]|nr:hypothetical protein [Anaerolineales bacterium]
MRHLLQANAKKEQATKPLSDLEVETDEMFQNAGKKESGTAIRRIRLANEPINGAGEDVCE